MKKIFSMVMLMVMAVTGLSTYYYVPPAGRKPIGIMIQVEQAKGKQSGKELSGQYWADSNWHNTGCVVVNSSTGTVFCSISEKHAGTTLSQVRISFDNVYYYFYDVTVSIKKDEPIFF